MDDFIKEAYEAAQKMYPEAIPGLLWFVTAIGLNAGEITEENIEWANSIISSVEEDDCWMRYNGDMNNL